MFGQDFGHRLRELRLAQGFTKEKFCEGDEVLSVRQLTRIETCLLYTSPSPRDED